MYHILKDLQILLIVIRTVKICDFSSYSSIPKLPSKRFYWHSHWSNSYLEKQGMVLLEGGLHYRSQPLCSRTQLGSNLISNKRYQDDLGPAGRLLNPLYPEM